jgi:hypothetical protein
LGAVQEEARAREIVWRQKQKTNNCKKGKPQNTPRRNNGHDTNNERCVYKVKCYNCNEKDHFLKKCTEPRRELKENANLTQKQWKENALLMASVSALTVASQ